MTYKIQNGLTKSVDEDLTCQRVVALLVAYLAGELELQTALALQEHLHDCEDCVAFLHTYRATISATRTLRYTAIPVALQSRMHDWLRDTLGYEGTPEHGTGGGLH